MNSLILMRALVVNLAPNTVLHALFGSLLICTTGCQLFLPVTIQDGIGAPYPQSELVEELVWDEEDNIVRGADGSDNWPLTWADDGHLYTAYGDGWGFFNPRPGDKLSLGYARIEDGPLDFVGTNIPSVGEEFGQGRRGKKASGLLMVEGVLYMWVRNADQNGQGCQLAMSTDYAENWTWSQWMFPDFGYCTFINYGKNYAGAIDDFVYMVTPDGPSAYEYSDGFILTRVPKNKILERDAYEFFVETQNDEPVWSTDVEEREAVFSNPGRSRRSSITYNAALERFFWWQGLPTTGDGERSAGGIGIYDAPTPWGPWTTVYFTPDWDVGPGETASFPSKWISEDGRMMYLVFSGDDFFSVRKATLMLK